MKVTFWRGPKFLNPLKADASHFFVEIFAEFVCFFVHIVADESHATTRCEYPIVKLAFVIGYFDFFSSVFGGRDGYDEIPILQGIGKQRHLRLADLAVVSFDVIDE